jgi:hypothetical protein
VTVVTDDVEFATKLIASGWLHEANVYIWPFKLGRA